jgi:hypothetical protein
MDGTVDTVDGVPNMASILDSIVLCVSTCFLVFIVGFGRSSFEVKLVSGYPVYDRADLLTMELLEQGSNHQSDTTTTIPCSVTLAGNAAHPMSPFKGQWVNQALLDALSLARSLYFTCWLWADENTPSNNIRDAIHNYHQEMTIRSAKKVQASAQAAQFLHTDVAIQQGNMTRGAAAAAAAAAANNTANSHS